MKLNLKNTFVLGTLMLVTTAVQAGEITPDEGLQRLTQNIETSEKNRDEYNRAIEQVSHNITTLDSASLELYSQKKKLLQQVGENNGTLVLHSKKLQELDRSRQDEERKKADDLSKIAQLEKTLAQLKELQKVRAERIQKLTQDRTSIEKSQKEGQSLQLTLNAEAKVIDQRLDGLKKEVSPWRTKKKGYEKEAARWSNELDRHEKMEAEVKLLMNSTT
jgi:chromosome segregation ATPase